MKVILFISACIFIAFFASSQTTGDAEKVLLQLSHLYNKEDYEELYLLNSPESKSRISEAQLTSFYKNKLRIPYGRIFSWKPTDNKDGVFNYTVTFTHGKLDLSLQLNSKNEITSIAWLPSKNRDIVKRDISKIKSNNPKHTKLQLLIDSLALDHLQNSVNCGLSIGIIEGDKTEMFFYGSNNKDKEQPPGKETMYEIGSVTKTFTGILLAHAVNEGRLKLTDDIRKYLPGQYPDLEYKGIPITIKNLSNHTSGLPRMPADLNKQPGYDKHDPYKNYSKEMMYSYLKKISIDTLPATNEYSNYATALLGIILENVYKKPYEELVRSYITEPAKMNNSKFNLSVNEQTKMATGYNEKDGSEADFWNLGAFNAAGGMKSDMEDMLQYLSANLNEINADYKLSHQQTYNDAAGMAVGLNWMLTNTADNKTLIWHNGKTAGFTSFCGYIKENRTGVIILNNSGVEVDDIAKGILNGL